MVRAFCPNDSGRDAFGLPDRQPFFFVVEFMHGTTWKSDTRQLA
jgi:hypothetical protein